MPFRVVLLSVVIACNHMPDSERPLAVTVTNTEGYNRRQTSRPQGITSAKLTCEDRRYSVDWKIDPPSGVRRTASHVKERVRFAKAAGQHSRNALSNSEMKVLTERKRRFE